MRVSLQLHPMIVCNLLPVSSGKNRLQCLEAVSSTQVLDDGRVKTCLSAGRTRQGGAIALSAGDFAGFTGLLGRETLPMRPLSKLTTSPLRVRRSVAGCV